MTRHRHLDEDADSWKDGSLDDFSLRRSQNRFGEILREPQPLKPIQAVHAVGPNIKKRDARKTRGVEQ